MTKRTMSTSTIAVGEHRLRHILDLAQRIQELYPNACEAEISQALGLGHATLNNYKHGRTLPRSTTYARVLTAAADILDDQEPDGKAPEARPARTYNRPARVPQEMVTPEAAKTVNRVPTIFATGVAAGAICGAFGAYILTAM